MKKNANGTWNDAIVKNKSLVTETKKSIMDMNNVVCDSISLDKQ
jgi:hypothetical protein